MRFPARWARERRGGAPVVPPIVYDPAADASLVAWYREDYTDDGAGNVQSWTDKAGTPVWGNVAAPLLANRPLAIASSNMNAQFACRFDGTDDRQFGSTTLSLYTRLHNDANLTAWFAFYPTATGRANNVIASSMAGFGAANRGFTIFYDDVDQALAVYISNGTAYIAQIQGGAGSCARDAAHIVSLRKNSDGIEVNLDGALYIATEWSGTPSTSDPGARLQWGRTNTGTVYFEGDLAEGGISDSYQDLAEVDRYLLARYG